MINQQTLVLEYVAQHGSITSLEAIKALGITRLSAVMYNLAKAGNTISGVTETAENRYGRSVHYKRYYINNTEA